MSTTTTKTGNTTSLATVLADYEIHYSSDRARDSVSGPEPSAAATNDGNPPGWPTALHRRVPPHRAVNRNLDPTERFVYRNAAERGFVNTMFFGLRLVTLAHRIWRATGGRIHDGYFRYKIGGEY